MASLLLPAFASILPRSVASFAFFTFNSTPRVSWGITQRGPISAFLVFLGVLTDSLVGVSPILTHRDTVPFQYSLDGHSSVVRPSSANPGPPIIPVVRPIPKHFSHFARSW